MQVCTSLQTDNHASTPPLSFLQVGCPTNGVKALKAICRLFNSWTYHFCTLYPSQPAYLHLSLHVCQFTRSLRLFNTNLPSAVFVRTSFGTRSFSVAALRIWNSLRLCILVPVLIPSVAASRSTIASRPSNPLNPFCLRLRFGFC